MIVASLRQVLRMRDSVGGAREEAVARARRGRYRTTRGRGRLEESMYL